jgi:hypothetical protein
VKLKLISMMLLVASLAGAQEAKGWIEGTVLNPDGKPVWAWDRMGNTRKIRLVGPTALVTTPNVEMGGLYSFRDLRPGVYEVYIESSKDSERQYRPQRINGVVVKPGVRTMLNITVHPGDKIEEIG